VNTLDELRNVIERIDSRTESLEAVKIMSAYLRKRLVQRQSEETQGKLTYQHYTDRDFVKLREFLRFSQFPRIRQAAEDFLTNLAGERPTPEQEATQLSEVEANAGN
jgi:hypothetical protein